VASDLEALYRNHYAEVLRFVHRRIPCRATSEDIVQDVFLRAAARLDAWEERGRSQAGWLMTIAANLVKDRWKSHGYRLTALVDDFSRFDGSMDPIAQWHDDREAAQRSHVLRMAILRLRSDLQREAMLLRHVDGLSIQETADRMGIHAGAVKALCTRATRHIAAALGVAA